MSLSFINGKQIVNSLSFIVENGIFRSNNHVKLYWNKKERDSTSDLEILNSITAYYCLFVKGKFMLIDSWLVCER